LEFPLGLREMPALPRKYLLGAQQRRALQLLAGIPFGATEAAMFLHGFTRGVLARLIHAGLATVQREKACANLSAASGSQSRAKRPQQGVATLGTQVSGFMADVETLWVDQFFERPIIRRVPASCCATWAVECQQESGLVQGYSPRAFRIAE